MNGIQTVEGTLAGIDFTTGTTVSYRIPGDPPVSGRTIIIPDGYTAREKALIRYALAQAETCMTTCGEGGDADGLHVGETVQREQ